MADQTKNRVQLILMEKAVEGQDPHLFQSLKERIRKALDITPNKMTLIINNRAELSIGELTTVARVLDVPIEEIIDHERATPQG